MSKKISAVLFAILLTILALTFVSCSMFGPKDTTGSSSYSFTEEISTIETEESQVITEDFEVENGVLKKYKGKDTVLTLPSGIKTIATYAFTNSGVKIVILSESVVTIDRYAFFNCETLENITISSKCKEISTGAFIGCSALKSVTFKNPQGWTVSIKADGSSASAVDTSDSSMNALMLTGKYMTHFWFNTGSSAETTASSETEVTETTEVTVVTETETTTVETTTETTIETETETTTEETTAPEVMIALPEGYNKYFNLDIGDSYEVIKDKVGGLCDSEKNGTYFWYTVSKYQGRDTYGTLSVTLKNGKADKITYIYGKELRYYQSTEQDVAITEDVNSIGESAFASNSYMKTVVIPNKIETIGMYAFMDCENLVSIDIMSGLKKVETYAFIGCRSLVKVFVTDMASWCEIDFNGPYSNPLSVAHQLFYNGKLISSLTIPKSVETIRKYTFYGSSTLLSVTIPSTVKLIEPFAFAGCPNLTGVTFETKDTWFVTSTPGIDGKIVDVNYSSKNDNYLSKDYTSYYWYLGEKPVSHRMAYDFDPKTIELDMTMSQVVGKVGFESSESEENQYYWYSDGYYEGQGEYALLIVNLERGKVNEVTFVKDREITYYKSDLEKVVITDKARFIGSNAFSSLKDMKEVIIPDTIKEIRSNAFNSCASLENVTIGAAVRTIFPRAFFGCSSIEKVTFKTAGGWKVYEEKPETATSIFVTNEKNAANNLKNTYLSFTWTCANAMTEHMSDTYFKYTYLSVGDTLENAVSILGYSCDAVEGSTYIWYSENYHEGLDDYDVLRISVLDGKVCEIEYIDGTTLSYWAGNRTEYTVNEKVTAIGGSAFYSASTLEKINLSKKVTSIGNSAFFGCTSLKVINIPSGVSSIGINAFENCSSLESVSFENANNWYVSQQENALTGTDVKLNNVGANATLLNSTYLKYYWYIVSGFNYIADDFSEYRNINLEEKLEAVRAKVGSEPTSMDGDTYYWMSVGYYLGREDYAVLSVTFDNLYVSEVQFVSNHELVYIKTNKDVVTLNKYATKGGDNLLTMNATVKEIIIPEGFTELGEFSFDGCVKLEKVTIPSSMRLIKPNAFKDCSKLSIITFVNTDNWALSNMASLEDYVSVDVTNPTVNAAYFTNDGLPYYLFTGSAVVIEKHLPDDYKGYSGIILDNSVSIALTSIGVNYDKYSGGTYYWYSDSYHKGLDNYSVLILAAQNGKVTEVSFISNASLVYWRGSVKTVTVDPLVKKIDSGAFTGSGVQTVRLGSSVTEIADFAFLNAESLTQIYMENSMKKIGNSAFNGCIYLKNVTFNGVQAEWNEISLNPNWREGSGISKVTGIRFTIEY